MCIAPEATSQSRKERTPWTSTQKKAHYLARRATHPKARASPKDRNRDHVFCVEAHIRLETVQHIMAEREHAVNLLERVGRIGPCTVSLQGDDGDRTTSAGAFSVTVPGLPSLTNFNLDGKRVLDSGATMSTGGVGLLQNTEELHAGYDLILTSRAVSPSPFSFANGEENVF